MGDAQESEARCLAHIKELGKPVLLLLNVHVGITDSDGFDRVDLEDFEYEMQDEFDQQHLDAIRQSLIDYGPKYGQNWSYIPYAYVHLKAAYMAQKEELSDYADDLYKLSRFDDAVCLIEKEVCESGGYFRLKSYSDSVSSHLIGILESLFEQSAENSRQGRLLVRTRRTLERWIDGYIERSEARINAFVDSVRDDLKGEANIFAEDNYNNRKAAQAWNKILASKKIEAQANDIIRDLERECNDRLTDLRREIDFDTKLGKYIPRRGRFKAYDVIDAKKTWNWGTKLIAGALTIGGIFITKELFIAGIAVGAIGELGSRIFGLDGIRDDARRKMRNQLYSSINQQCEWLNREMQTTFSKCIVKDQLTHMCKEIDSVVSALFELSNVQRNLAIQINKQLRILNRATLNEALAYLGYQGQERSLVEIARIPGVTTALILNDGTKLPSSLRGEVGRLLGEFIRYVFFTENTKTLISRLIERGFDRNKIRIDRIGNEPRIAHITGLGKLTGDALTGIRLAEQITELVIME